MNTSSLAIAWNWEFDQDFIAGIEHECARRGISTYRVDPANLAETIHSIESGALRFRALYDRASDADTAFLSLVALLRGPSIYRINPWDRVVRAVDKATMHLELIAHGFQVPYTVILSPFSLSQHVSVTDEQFRRLGSPFVIKPANTTGGGTGVILHAGTIHDVLAARQEHPDDKYLLQEKLIPRNLDGQRGWFRVYYVFGEIIPCWWDDGTHVYHELSADEERRFGLAGLRDTSRGIASICGLDFFSTEIALMGDGRFVAVDYVNEVCDMRLQSKYHNGVPDPIVHRIEACIAERVVEHVRTSSPAGQELPGRTIEEPHA
jgi:hypothetical protein